MILAGGGIGAWRGRGNGRSRRADRWRVRVCRGEWPVVEGGGDAGEPGSAGAGFDGFGEEGGFEGDSAGSAPTGGGSLLDLSELGLTLRMEALHVRLAGALEGFAVLVPDDDGLGEESVGDGVLRRACSALGSFGAARAGAVGARRGNAFFGRHDGLVGRLGPRQAGGPKTGEISPEPIIGTSFPNDSR